MAAFLGATVAQSVLEWAGDGLSPGYGQNMTLSELCRDACEFHIRELAQLLHLGPFCEQNKCS